MSEDTFKRLKAILKAIQEGKEFSTNVARDFLIVAKDKYFIVSTRDTIDHGLETGIVGKNNIVIVQYYSSKEEAINGHNKWVFDLQMGNIKFNDVSIFGEEGITLTPLDGVPDENT